jgi:hypothetical protein
VAKLRTSYRDLPEVLHYFDAVETDVKENAEDFLPRPVPQPEKATLATLTPALGKGRFRRYQVKGHQAASLSTISRGRSIRNGLN